MSYHAPNTGDPELDKQLRAEDYDMLFPRLLEARESGVEQRFNVWLDKLTLIDKERVTAWLRAEWDSLDHFQRVAARIRLGRCLADLPLD